MKISQNFYKKIMLISAYEMAILGNYLLLKIALNYFDASIETQNKAMDTANYLIGVAQPLGIFGIFNYCKKPAKEQEISCAEPNQEMAAP